MDAKYMMVADLKKIEIFYYRHLAELLERYQVRFR